MSWDLANTVVDSAVSGIVISMLLKISWRLGEIKAEVQVLRASSFAIRTELKVRGLLES